MKVTEGELKREEEASLEVHDKYIDVQVLIAGEVETMGWRKRRECRVPRGPFDAEEDIRFFADRPQLFVGISPDSSSVANRIFSIFCSGLTVTQFKRP